MTRADVTARVLEAKRQLGLTWKEIAAKIGKGSPVFYIAALVGHHALTAEEARKAGTLLKLDEIAVKILAEIPENRGASLEMPRSDPMIYRFLRNCPGLWGRL